MVFFKKEIDSDNSFVNELLEVKTINGLLYLYIERKNLGKDRLKECMVFFNKNDALLHASKSFELFEEKDV